VREEQNNPRTDKFFVTLSRCDKTREQVAAFLSTIGSQYAVCRERHLETADEDLTPFHIHFYVKTNAPTNYAQLRRTINDGLFGGENPTTAINVNNVLPQQINRHLIYTTKEDRDALLVHISRRKASDYYQCVKWAEENHQRPISTVDPFVFEHKQHLNYLTKMHQEIHQDFCNAQDKIRRTEAEENFLSTFSINENTWVQKVWDFAHSVQIPNEGTPSKKNLYLFGRAGVGKTYFTEMLFPQTINAFIPSMCEDMFAFSGLNDSYDGIYIPDLAEGGLLNSKVREIILRLMEGKKVSIPSKFKDGFNFRKEIPIIICSNYPPPQPQEFQRRLTIIEADVSWEQCITRI
jgi:hypothetical protein